MPDTVPTEVVDEDALRAFGYTSRYLPLQEHDKADCWIERPPHGALARPDPRVKETEDALQAASALPTSNFGTLTLKEDFPHRPGFGTVGASVVLWTNHVEIVPAMDLVLYRYDLSVTPSTTGKRLMRVIKLLLDTPLLAAQRDNLVTDFKSTLLCRELLWADRAVIEVQYLAENEDEPRQTDTAYQIQLLYTNTLAVSELMGYLTSTSTNASFDDTPQLVQAFNIFMNHFARSHGDQATVGSSRNFSLNPGASKRSLGAGLTAIRGFFSSVRIATCRVLVNVNVTHSVFYEAGALDEVMTGFSKVHSNGKPSLDRFLHKVRVKTTHLPERKNRSGVVIERPKTILGLVTAHDGSDLVHPPIIEGFGASSMEVQFWLEEGTATSAKSGKAGGKSNTERVQGSNGRYISIYDFFRTRLSSAFIFILLRHLLTQVQAMGESYADLSFRSSTRAPRNDRRIFLPKSVSSCRDRPSDPNSIPLTHSP